MADIQMISDTEFKTVSRGNEFTLIKEKDRWAMYVVNAAVRAWNRGFAAPKYFNSLQEVEEKYKTWRGISQLIEG